MSVARFYHLWQEQLPECLLPEGDEANERFVELIKKALDEKYLQEQLCNLKGEHITFKMFYVWPNRKESNSKRLEYPVRIWTQHQE